MATIFSAVDDYDFLDSDLSTGGNGCWLTGQKFN
jgi:hypothetical protein